MLKLTFCLHRLPHLTRAEFQRYWREEHAPLVQKHTETLNIARYVQTHTITHDVNQMLIDSRGGPEGYDGIAELWWTDWETYFAIGDKPGGPEAGAALLKDEATFIDLKRSPLWFNIEHPIIE